MAARTKAERKYPDLRAPNTLPPGKPPKVKRPYTTNAHVRRGQATKQR